MSRLAGLELGGTNANVVLGHGTDIVERVRFPVTTPEETLALVAGQLSEWNQQVEIEALGVASFGPVGTRPDLPSYGRIIRTPKSGWDRTDLLGVLAPLIDGPVAIQTDVTAAALAEGRWGAARGCSDHAYITVGTGVGVGIVAGNRPLTGQLHPEGGHIGVRRRADDSFAGSCPFHGDCLEGLISGTALAARTGRDGATLSDQDSVWTSMVDSLAEACATFLMALACEKIVLGGGVINQRNWIVDQTAELCARKLADYLPFVSDRAPLFAAELGDNAGPRGALLIAEAVLG